MEIGEALRNARLEQKISLDKIENDTKIRKRYLEAMEHEEWNIFPGKVYLRGFLKIYSTYLGLNEKELLNSFDSYIVEENKAQSLPEKIEMPGKPRRRLSIIVGIVAVLLLAASQYFYQNFLTEPFPSQEKNPTPQLTEKQEQGDNPDNDNPAVVDNNESPGKEMPIDNVNSAGLDKFSLKIKCLQDRCWVKVDDGQKVLFEGTLNKGIEKSFTGLTKVSFRLGNAGNAQVFLNEKDYGTLGKEGEVITKQYELENNEIKEVNL